MSEIWNRRRPDVRFEDLTTEQQLAAEAKNGRFCPPIAQNRPRAIFALRTGDYTTRCHQNPLKTKAQRQSKSQIPSAAVLYSHRGGQCPPELSSSVPARQPAGSLNNRILSPPNDRTTALNFVFCSPDSRFGAHTIATGSIPLPGAGVGCWLYVN